jgi:hypothetical protein
MNRAKRPEGNGGASWWRETPSAWTERKLDDASTIGAQRTALVGAGLTLAHLCRYKFPLHFIVVRANCHGSFHLKRWPNEPGLGVAICPCRYSGITFAAKHIRVQTSMFKAWTVDIPDWHYNAQFVSEAASQVPSGTPAMKFLFTFEILLGSLPV